MDKTFEKFLRREIDLAAVGAGRRTDNSPYFCTPKGASIFGWAGVDGIHFCFIRGFGGTVFAVSPMNTPPHFVHPLARSFEDFLRLLLACGDTAALEQAWMWDEAQFDDFLREYPPTPEQREVLSQIAKRLGLTPMERPWAYIREVQSSFDYGKIKYTEDYYDLVPEPAPQPAPPAWKVTFDGGFWDRSGRARAGKELPLGKEFTWAGHVWLIPAAYLCAKGLVLDLCARVEPADIRAFTDKWDLRPENDSAVNFTREQRMQMDLENPLRMDLRPRVEVNGKPLRFSRGCAVSFNPCVPEGFTNELEAKWAVEHYGLDASRGWVISRYSFPWPWKRRPQIKSLSLTMEQQPDHVPGPRFQAHQPGDTFVFTHPVSGIEYTLTVRALERQTLPAGTFGAGGYVYPTNTVAMSYTLSPEPEESIHVSDCDEGDRPRRAEPQDPLSPEAQGFAAVMAVMGVIGGADGPAAVTVGGRPQGKLRAAYASLHFEPVEKDVEWRVDFSIKRFEDASFTLL